MSSDAWAQLGFNPYHPATAKKEADMPEDNTYNGWKNWDTWAAHLWLTGNDELTWKFARGAAYDADPMPHLMALLEELGNPDGIVYTNVNWQEVIEALREE